MIVWISPNYTNSQISNTFGNRSDFFIKIPAVFYLILNMQIHLTSLKGEQGQIKHLLLFVFVHSNSVRIWYHDFELKLSFVAHFRQFQHFWFHGSQLSLLSLTAFLGTASSCLHRLVLGCSVAVQPQRAESQQLAGWHVGMYNKQEIQLYFLGTDEDQNRHLFFSYF